MPNQRILAPMPLMVTWPIWLCPHCGCPYPDLEYSEIDWLKMFNLAAKLVPPFPPGFLTEHMYSQLPSYNNTDEADQYVLPQA
jgi:hypothetical protein